MDEDLTEEEALSKLLGDGVLFAGQHETAFGLTVILCVNCSDIFAWGCADSESLPYDEVLNLYREHKKGEFGSVRWCCRRRNQKPQGPVESIMKARGVWDDEMDKLKNNFYDSAIKEKTLMKSEVELVEVCPKCGVSLVGEEIPEKSREFFGGAKNFHRTIGIYDRDKDKTVEFMCPDCSHRWPRE